MKNYTKDQHEISWQMEKKLYEKYPLQLYWNNHAWDHVTTYDSDAKDKGDFIINGTDIKLEMRTFDFSWRECTVHQRRTHEVDNVTGAYGEPKDLSKTVLVLFDGIVTAVMPMATVPVKYYLNDKFPSQRSAWERAYIVPTKDFKKVDFGRWLPIIKIVGIT